MIVEIITTGTELLLGQIVNTNATYLSRQLNQLGFHVLHHTTVGDNQDRMTQILTTALNRADLIITTGGLGPTQGDITKEVTAQVLQRSLYIHEPSMRRIKCFFDHRHACMPESNLRQAMIPEGAIVLNNERGTAPGVIIENNEKTIINLPGPPYELEGMFQQAVIPYLNTRFGIQGAIISKVLHTYGIGESALEEKIKDLILTQTNPTIALLAGPGEVIIRITAKGQTETHANQLIETLQQTIYERISDHIFGIDADTMETVVGNTLARKNLTLALAESCTGGLVTSRITDVSGSSKYLCGSIICYSNSIKIQELGVPQQTIAMQGAVSSETAVAMAAGIRKKFNTDIGIGITGIAGPNGGTDAKPVGLVYIAIDGPAGIKCDKHQFIGQRTDIKYRASQATLDILRRYVHDL